MSPRKKFEAYNASITLTRRQELRALFRSVRRKHDRSTEWKTRRRLRIEGNPCCEKCGSTLKLECHHLTYARAGDEAWDDLQVLCKVCHTEESRNGPTFHDYPDELTPAELLRRKAQHILLVSRLK